MDSQRAKEVVKDITTLVRSMMMRGRRRENFETSRKVISELLLPPRSFHRRVSRVRTRLKVDDERA